MAPSARPSSTAYRGAVNGDVCGLNNAMQATMRPPTTPINIDGWTTSGLERAAVHTQPAENVVRATNRSALNAAPDTVMRSAVTPAIAFRKTDSRSAGFVRAMELSTLWGSAPMPARDKARPEIGHYSYTVKLHKILAGGAAPYQYSANDVCYQT